jgi:hypothetical protein
MDKLLGKGTFAQVYMAALEKSKPNEASDQNHNSNDGNENKKTEPLAMKIISS